MENKMTDEEMIQKSKEMDEVFNNTSSMVLKDVAEIVGRDLTDEETKKLNQSLKAHFLLTTLMLKATI